MFSWLKRNEMCVVTNIAKKKYTSILPFGSNDWSASKQKEILEESVKRLAKKL